MRTLWIRRNFCAYRESNTDTPDAHFVVRPLFTHTRGMGVWTFLIRLIQINSSRLCEGKGSELQQCGEDCQQGATCLSLCCWYRCYCFRCCYSWRPQLRRQNPYHHGATPERQLASRWVNTASSVIPSREPLFENFVRRLFTFIIINICHTGLTFSSSALCRQGVLTGFVGIAQKKHRLIP